MKIVFDTNVLVSALISDGKPRELLNTIVIRGHTVIISKKIIKEFVEVTADPKIQKYVTRHEVARFLHNLLPVSKVVIVRSKMGESRDPKDNPILATAYDGRADYLVSGDEDLLNMEKFRGIRIVKVAEMLKMFK